ncbi:hypothetical protein D3C85_1811800 [compost metagenome]
MRLSNSMPKLCATPDTRWLTMNNRKMMISNLRRSMLRVSSIIGNEVSATIQA